MSQWIPLLQVLAVPLLGLLGRLLAQRGPVRLQHRIDVHSRMLKELPEDMRDHINSLLREETRMLARQEWRRLHRTVDGASIGAIAVVGGVGGGVFAWGLRAGKGWTISIGIVVGLFCALLIAAGVGQVYKYPDETPFDDLQ